MPVDYICVPIKKISDTLFLGSYAFSFCSEGTLALGSAVLVATFNANHDTRVNLKNATTKVCSRLNQLAIPIRVFLVGCSFI